MITFSFAQEVIQHEKYPNGTMKSRLLSYRNGSHIFSFWDSNGDYIISTWIKGKPHKLEVKTNKYPVEIHTFTKPIDTKIYEKFNENLKPSSFATKKVIIYYKEFKKFETYERKDNRFLLVDESKSNHQHFQSLKTVIPPAVEKAGNNRDEDRFQW